MDTGISAAELIKFTIEGVTLLGGGSVLMLRIGRLMEKFEQIVSQQTKEISDLKLEVAQMRGVVTQIALQGERITALQSRIDTVDKRLYDLQHGEGFVMPLRNRVIESG